MTVTVENKLWDLLPEVIIDFLQKIILRDNTVQTIRLVPLKLSSDYIQEIVLENRDRIATQRVFGFVPVSAKLIVSHDNGKAVMQLAA